MPYIVVVSLMLAACIAFYKLLLAKETFFRLNRYVLISCLLLSFVLPAIPVPEQFAFQKTGFGEEVTRAGSLPVREKPRKMAHPIEPGKQKQQQDPKASTNILEVKENRLNVPVILMWIKWMYWFGVVVFGINFLVQLFVLLYRAYTKPFIRDGKFRIVELSGDKAPCSFLNNIFVNPEKYDWETYSQILLHEKIHIQQGHSVDILLAEIALVFQWFNPFAWLYRTEIESNLEFLTDNELLDNKQIDRSGYQVSLLKVSTPHLPLGLTANYNQSLLKRRLRMMNAKRSNIHTSWKYFFLFPLFLMFMSLFNKPAAPVGPAAGDPFIKEKTTIAKETVPGTSAGADSLTQKKDGQKLDLRTQKKKEDKIKGRKDPANDVVTPKPPGQDVDTAIKPGSSRGENPGGSIDALTAYIQSLEQLGYKNLSLNQLAQLKSADVSPELIKTFQTLGFKEIQVEDLAASKRLAITPDYIRQVRSMGYPDISMQHLVQFKSLGITQEYISKLRALGFQDLPAAQLVPLKFHQGSPELVQEYKNLEVVINAIHEITAAQVWGVTPAFVVEVRKKGYHYTSLSDYTRLKRILD
ncbi:MAG TPA: M56 family metallopeptidase [Chitinophagaceae bacterium]|nr:M56 family metallopeptidase [Chitinophagaceae bacterium]